MREIQKIEAEACSRWTTACLFSTFMFFIAKEGGPELNHHCFSLCLISGFLCFRWTGTYLFIGLIFTKNIKLGPFS